MYGFIRIFAVIIIVLVFLFTAIGFMAPAETSFSISEQIGSPVTVVWRTLINDVKTPEWNAQVARINILGGSGYRDGAELNVFLRDAGKEVLTRAKIVSFVPEKKLVFLELPVSKKPLLRKQKRAYELKSLLDGSTELSVSISYETAGFITRVLDRLYLRGLLMNTHRMELRQLKRHIENL